MNASAPQFSVVIPTYKRPVQLQDCLRAFASLYPTDARYEIIVAQDGAGALREAALLRAFAGLPLRVVTIAHAGPAAARNAGAAAARGEFLAFMDDDCAPAPGWLDALEAELRSTPECALGGLTVNGLPHNPFAAASQALVEHLYRQWNADGQDARFFTSNNLVAPRARFEALGGFDTRFPLAAAEDRDFCERWREAGWALRYAPQVQIYHYHNLTARSFVRQHFGYGRGAYHYHRLRMARGGAGVQVATLQFYAGLVFGQRCLLTGALLALTQIANLAGYFFECVRSGR